MYSIRLFKFAPASALTPKSENDMSLSPDRLMISPSYPSSEKRRLLPFPTTLYGIFTRFAESTSSLREYRLFTVTK